MGSPDFALPILDALVQSGRYRPLLVITQPDRAKGRGRRVLPTPVKARAVELGIPVRAMARSDYEAVAAEIVALRPDAIAVAAFGLILKRDLLEAPPLGCVNVHASLLPRYRGVSPIQAAILAGDRETGCTTMRMDEGIDTGGILLRAAVEIRTDDTAGTLSERLAIVGARLLIQTLDGLREGVIHPVPQNDASASYAKKIRKEDGLIDWTLDAETIERRIRAMSPWPSAYTHVGGRRLIVLEAAVCRAPGAALGPGVVVRTTPLVVACGSDALEIRRLQVEGRKAMAPQAFLTGHPLEAGDKFC